MNLEEGKNILRENKEIKLILIKSGKIIYKSTKRGIAPMYEIATKYREEARDGIILDRVIGRGAAMLASYIGIGEIYSELLSNGAKEVLESKNIRYSFTEDTPYIQNRDKTDYCPIEKLSMKTEDEKVLLEQVGKFLEEIKKNNIILNILRRNNMYNEKNTKKMVIAGLLLSIGLIIPSIFHLTGIPGTIFLPMHIPVILGGFLLPPVYALLLGILTPFINSLITGMPIFFPIGLIMMVELASYGLIISLLVKKTKIPTMVSLIISLILGRIIGGLFIYVLSSFFIMELSPVIFITGAIMAGLPGIAIQLILIPILVHSINRYTTINMEWD